MLELVEAEKVSGQATVRGGVARSKDVAESIKQAIKETEAHGFSVTR